MSETDWRKAGRLTWTDENWANHLGCPVKDIPSIRKYLDNNYVVAIERNKFTGKYSLAMYRYDVAPSGARRLQLLLSDDKHGSVDVKQAIHDANNVISKLELTDFWSKALNVPKRALQMLLIRER